MKKLYQLIVMGLIITSGSVTGAEWHQAQGSTPGEFVKTIEARNFDFNQLFAIGENGGFYISRDAGNSWELTWSFPQRLRDIEVFYDSNIFTDVIMVVGENGLAARSNDMGISWQEIYPTTDNFTSILFNQNYNTLWAADESGMVWLSYSYGAVWDTAFAPSEGMFVKKMVNADFNIYMLGVRNDSSFIYQVDAAAAFYNNDFDPAADIIVESLHYRNPPLSFAGLYMAGNDVNTGETVVYSRLITEGLDSRVELFRQPGITVTDMDMFSIFDDGSAQPGNRPIDILWMTTAEGEIWESRDLSGIWRQVYQTENGQPLTAILTNKSGYYDQGFALAMARDEVIKYSFELDYFSPFKGDQISNPLDRIDMHFSAPVDLLSVENSVNVISNLSGTVPLRAAYDLFDSLAVHLLIDRPFSQNSVPGEKWTISLIDTIRMINSPDDPPSISPFTLGVEFLPSVSGTLDFSTNPAADLISNSTTNFVTGFFNEDENLDAIAFNNNGYLSILETDGMGNIINMVDITLPVDISVNVSLKEQLLSADLNNDGHFDLILYDTFSAYAITNNSSGLTFDFSTDGFPKYSSQNIKEMRIIDANRNRQPDLLVLNDSLVIRPDIDETLFGRSSFVVDPFPVISRFEISDFNLNGNMDIVGIAANGIYFYAAYDNFEYNQAQFFPGLLNYKNLQLTDLNIDKRAEIIAYDDFSVDIWKYEEASQSFFLTPESPIVQQNGEFIEDIVLQDFGGQENGLNQRLMDIVILTSASTIKIFENSSFSDNISFLERTDKEINLDIPANNLLFWNRDLYLDLLAVNKNTGAVQNVLNDSWIPVINPVSIESDGVQISWEPFPIENGTFIEYRLKRESSFDFNDTRDFVFNNVSQTVFIDNDTRRFHEYNYYLEVHYNSSGIDIFSASPRVSARLINDVSGPLSGILSDSIRGYLVQDSVVVEQGQSLIINGGVEFAFAPGARINIHGQLNVRGTFTSMVEFHPYEPFDQQQRQPWLGFNLFPGVDTVTFEWFSIGGATRAITANARPFRMYLGGISQNNTGIFVSGDTLILENIVLDSNLVALEFAAGSRAFVKNVNVMNNELGILANTGSDVNIKNSIIWGNLTGDVNILGGNVKIAYSTVQRVNGTATLNQVNNSIGPVYANLNDEIPYRPSPNSPTIDSGDPADDFSQEPMPNGGRINQGLLGGTFLATPSQRANTAPYLLASPGLTAYAEQEYLFRIETADNENDVVVIEPVSLPLWLNFNDDNSFTGTPVSAQIGNHSLSFVLRDYYGGATPYTFTITVVAAQVLDPVTNLLLTPLDQAVRISFTMPASFDLYDGTYIFLASDTNNAQQAETFIQIDTVFSAGFTPTIIIDSLKINQTYFVAVVNYYLTGTDIFSEPLMGSFRTLEPFAEINDGDQEFELPVNQTLSNQVVVKNSGLGTLLFHLNFQTDSLTRVWFDIDTTEKKVAPGDSVAVVYHIHPNKFLPRGPKEARVSVLGENISVNPGITIRLIPIFDDFAPTIRITAQPANLNIKQSLFSVHFYADDFYLNDSTSYPIGEAEESLYKFYRLYSGQEANAILIDSADSLKDNSLIFYPLDDGEYSLILWATDAEGNVKPLAQRKIIRFIINASQTTISRNRWHMLSIPRPIEVSWQNYERDSVVQIFRWDNEEDRYLSVTEFSEESQPMGQAAWVITKNNFDIPLTAINQAGLSDTLTTPVTVGWNQIGTPLTYLTSWGNMSFIPQGSQEIPLLEAISDSLIDAGVHWYKYNNDGSAGYETQLIDDTSATATAVPWRGYFIKSNVNGILKFTTQAYDALETIARSNEITPASFSKSNAYDNGWMFNISLVTENYKDVRNIFGLSKDGKIHDAHEPPHMGNYSALYFVKNNNRLIRNVYKDFLNFEEIKQWEFTVESHNSAQEHILSWDQDRMASSGLYFFLVDTKKEKYIEMNELHEYVFKPGDFKRDFVLYSTQDPAFKPAIIPAEFRLNQNYPNPFNPNTTIQFGIPVKMAGKKINIKIYNILGQEIKELLNGSFEAGFHEIKWDGLNVSGQSVASGLYFYTLTTGGARITRKMILIR